jgi:hypothetical protein
MTTRKAGSGGIDSLMRAMREQIGGYTHAETKKLVKGVYIPDFAERWVRDSNVYLLGMIEMHVGRQGAGKSTQLMRMGRIFLDAGGLFVYIETEGKYTPAFVEATLGDRAFSDRYLAVHVKTIGEDDPGKRRKGRRTRTEEELEGEMREAMGWFGHVYRVIRWHRENCPERPLLIGVDTVISAASQALVETYNEEEGRLGEINTAPLRQAKILKEWLKLVGADLRDGNVLLVFTNHVTEEITLTGPPRFGRAETRWSGGSALGQRAATIVEYDKAGVEKTSPNDIRTWTRITLRKVSNGTGTRSLRVSFSAGRFLAGADGEYIRGADGEKIRVVEWNWPEAGVDVLSRCFNSEHAPEYERIGLAEDRRQLRMTTGGTAAARTYTLRAFAEEDETRQLWSLDGLSAAELAAAVENSGEVQRALQNSLLTHVMRHTVYQLAADGEAKGDSDGSGDEEAGEEGPAEQEQDP